MIVRVLTIETKQYVGSHFETQEPYHTICIIIAGCYSVWIGEPLSMWETSQVSATHHGTAHQQFKRDFQRYLVQLHAVADTGLNLYSFWEMFYWNNLRNLQCGLLKVITRQKIKLI